MLSSKKLKFIPLFAEILKNVTLEVRSNSMNKKGFTLIELMIAISIVAILATIGIISYQKTQSIGRDHRRKQDLKAMQVALELYFQKNGMYPPGSNGSCTDAAYQSNASSWDTAANTNLSIILN